MMKRASLPLHWAMSAGGTNRASSDVRYSVALGGRPDMAQTAQFGRE